MINMVGGKYGNLIVVSRSPNNKQGRAMWECRCICGEITIVSGTAIRDGTIKSCGCWRRKRMEGLNKSHGESRPESPEYKAWHNMKDRCFNPNATDGKYWMGRGIKVCDRWMNSFENFLGDMGRKPVGFTLDRIDSDGDYEPGNCRWATWKEQRKNQRRTNSRAFVQST